MQGQQQRHQEPGSNGSGDFPLFLLHIRSIHTSWKKPRIAPPSTEGASHVLANGGLRRLAVATTNAPTVREFSKVRRSAQVVCEVGACVCSTLGSVWQRAPQPARSRLDLSQSCCSSLGIAAQQGAPTRSSGPVPPPRPPHVSAAPVAAAASNSVAIKAVLHAAAEGCRDDVGPAATAGALLASALTGCLTVPAVGAPVLGASPLGSAPPRSAANALHCPLQCTLCVRLSCGHVMGCEGRCSLGLVPAALPRCEYVLPAFPGLCTSKPPGPQALCWLGCSSPTPRPRPAVPSGAQARPCIRAPPRPRHQAWAALSWQTRQCRGGDQPPRRKMPRSPAPPAASTASPSLPRLPPAAHL